MKKLLILVLVLLAAYFAYQKFVVGSLSDEQRQVQVLADEFSAAKQRLAQAERSAGISGMDTTGDFDGVVHAVGTMLEKLQRLADGLTEKKAVDMAEKLAGEMRAFLDRKQ